MATLRDLRKSLRKGISPKSPEATPMMKILSMSEGDMVWVKQSSEHLHDLKPTDKLTVKFGNRSDGIVFEGYVNYGDFQYLLERDKVSLYDYSSRKNVICLK